MWPETQPGSSCPDALAPPPTGTNRWIDLKAPSAAVLSTLGDRFGFDPISLRDCGEYGRHSKVDEYARYLFIVIHAFSEGKDDPHDVHIHEIHAFLSDSFLVTVHDAEVAPQEAVFRRAGSDPSVLGRGPGWALLLAAEAMVAEAIPLVDRLSDQLDTLERSVIEDGLGIELPKLFAVKRSAVAMRRVLRPLRDTLGTLCRRSDDRISAQTVQHLRSLGDRVHRLLEVVEETREVALSTVAANQSLQVQRTNNVMKKLTVLSAMFMPLGVIVGFWGQNFRFLPTASPLAFALTLASMLIVPIGLMEWFRRYWL